LDRNATGFSNRGRSKRAKRIAVKRCAARGDQDSEGEDENENDDRDDEREGEDLRLKKKELSKRGQEARKILQVRTAFYSC
jgi:hypothetical protein